MRTIKTIISLLIFMTLISCLPSIKSGQEVVFVAIANKDIDKLGMIALNNGNDDVRVAATKGLKRFPSSEKATNYLIEIISKTSNPNIKIEAITGLSYQLDIDSARTLVADYLANGNINTKLPLIDNIKNADGIDRDTKIQFLRIPLNDQNPDVRLTAAINLRKLEDFSGSEVVNELCRTAFLPTKRRAAAEMIHHINQKFFKNIKYISNNETDDIVKNYANMVLDRMIENGMDKNFIVKRKTKNINTSQIVKNNDEIINKLRQTTPHRINKNKYLIAIGIENYTDLPDVKYAKRSTKLIVDTFQKLIGIKTENVLLITGKNATSSRIKYKINTFSKNLDSNSIVYLYYTGHGAPHKDGVYILPNDATMEQYDDDYFELNSFIDNIKKNNPKHLFAFIDSCFSGRISPKKLLFDGVAPVIIVSKILNKNNASNLTLFTASKKNQFANAYEIKKQRLFSYFLAKSIINGNLATEEINKDVSKNVSNYSKSRGESYKQDIAIFGKTNSIL